MTEGSSDAELLTAFDKEGSQEAFAILARRYAGLLYHAALRQSGCAQAAEEAAQNALAILARKASSLAAGPSLAPWLHRTVCFEAQKLRRKDHRHHDRMKRLYDSTRAGAPSVPADHAEEITLHVDQEINALSEQDRQVVLLRYFEGWTFEEMAERFGGQAATWRQRGSRVVAKLRHRLARRGVEVTATVLVTGLSAAFTNPAPAAVVASLAATPLRIAATLQWSTLALHTLSTMKIKQSVIAAAVLMTVLVPLGYQAVAVHRARANVLALETAVGTLEAAAAGTSTAPGKPTPLTAASSSGHEKSTLDSPSSGIDLHSLARLIAQGGEANPIEVAKVRMRLSAMTAEALEALIATAETLEFPPNQRRQLYEKLLELLRDKDPAQATATGMRLVESMSGSDARLFWMNPLPNTLREWAQRDSATALAWFESQRSAGAFEGKSLAGDDLTGWMAAGLFTGSMWGGNREAGLAFFNSLDEGAKAMSLRRFGTSNTAGEDMDLILKLASGLGSSDAKSEALMGAASSLGRAGLDQAGAFIARAGLPPAEMRNLLLNAASAQLREHQSGVEATVTWLRAQTPAGQTEKALGYYLGEAAFTNHTAIKARVDAEIAAGASDVFLGAFIRNAAQRTSTMGLAAGYLPQLTDPAERVRTLREIQQGHSDVARAAAIQAGVSAIELDAAVPAR